MAIPPVPPLNLDPAATRIDASAFVADTARLIGDVTIGRNCSIWFGAVLRGDVAPIVIGEESNVQDGAIIHVDRGRPCVVGRGVSVAHGAILHAATIGDHVLVGIGARVLSGAVVGENSIVGAGAVVTEGAVVPPRSLVLGVPARVVKPVTAEQIERIHGVAYRYTAYAQAYKQRLTGDVGARPAPPDDGS